jgi:hypothetical protein
VNAHVKRLLYLLVLLSLIPGGWLAYRRVQHEGRRASVTLLIDELALTEQAAYKGLVPSALAERYREAGLNGVALFEDTLETLALKGRIALLPSTDARAAAALRGEGLSLPPQSLLVAELEPGALEGALAKTAPAPAAITLAGRTWYVFSDPAGGSGAERPAGPDRELLASYYEAGWDIAYRPLNYPGLQNVGSDFPPEARYLIHGGLEVAGNPEKLEDTVAASQSYLTGLIEGTTQAGLADILGEVPAARVFSLAQDWLNTLPPEEAASKYVLAASERGAQLLYVRPYTTETVGEMVTSTETLIRSLRAGLEARGFSVEPVEAAAYESPALLRALASVGVLAGLALVAGLYPGLWGALVALGVLALGLLAGGLSWGALALVAALSFPVLGYALLPPKLWALGAATLVSLVGAALLAAVGSDRNTLLAVTPFAGVAATLVVPPALFALHLALRERPLARWVTDFWNAPVRLGDVLLTLLGAAALALLLLRRGNFPVLPASEAELGLRALLSEWFARPRFKELLGHPLAVLALLNARWPLWIRGLLLTAGVVAQASVVNSFSHYHTPLLVSLERTLVALVLGLALGLLLTPVVRLGERLVSRWLSAAQGSATETAPSPTPRTHASSQSPLPKPRRSSARGQGS